MPRPRREDYEGAWQHVMNRGVDRAPIFRSDVDRQIFLEAGLVREPQDWPWSSAGAYLGTRSAPSWLRTDAILEMFRAMSKREYRDFIAAEVDEPTRATYQHWHVEQSWGQTRRV
jgi:hypothetical protein